MGPATECSIVIPVFNEARNHPFELILVDNHSTDRTPRIIAEAAGRDLGYPLTCLPEPRPGVAHARKAGMDLAVARSLERDRRCGRRTDMDFAVAVPDWPTSLRMREALLSSNLFQVRGKALHAFTFMTSTPVDLIPFGGVLRSDLTIAWP